MSAKYLRFTKFLDMLLKFTRPLGLRVSEEESGGGMLAVKPAPRENLTPQKEQEEALKPRLV